MSGTRADLANSDFLTILNEDFEAYCETICFDGLNVLYIKIKMKITTN